jgi:uncharacterized membrane protein
VAELQRLKNRDVICAAVLVLFSMAAWMQAIALPARASLFPRLEIALLFGLSVIYLVRSLWRAQPVQSVEPFFRNLGRLLVALVLITIYVFIFPRIGFFTATFVFIPVFSFVIGFRDAKTLLLGAVLFTVSAWVVFVVLLGRRLPPEVFLSAIFGGGA